MQNPIITPAIAEQICPKHGIALHGSKRDARIPWLIAVDVSTPAFPRRRLKPREIRSSASNIVADTHVRKETAHAIASLHHGAVLARVDLEPVRMKMTLELSCPL
ncbi:hypothetical protein CCHR01_15080 [Colletotrichum chrysophilum]|uniref:Uncharacterized protein n=1 Tax=Colletotrichum chrysophilum TaxID=1836956 RepID=A0AAD9A6C8_9PEZI|nr:hypothetical protein CCHR01_15080 [Colletotrichum chrysophilum]